MTEASVCLTSESIRRSSQSRIEPVTVVEREEESRLAQLHDCVDNSMQLPGSIQIVAGDLLRPRQVAFFLSG